MRGAKPLQIFHAGRHTATSGEVLDFSAADLAATARAYDPKLHEAPLVVGHPTTDAPAYGWVSALRAGDGLEAETDQVDPAFAEMVNDGRFKHISASFYAPQARGNPTPGVYYLRHVGFLGAQPPAVKGLRPAQFSASEEGVIEFSDESADETLWLRFKSWLFGHLNAEAAFAETEYAGPHQSYPIAVADDVRKAWNLAGHAANPDAVRAKIVAIAIKHGWTAALPDTAHAWAKTHNLKFSEEVDMNDIELQKEREALAAVKAAQDAAFAEREGKIAAAEAKAARAGVVEFVEGLVKGGQVLPRDQAPLVEFLAAQPADRVIEFAEGEQRIKKPAQEWFKTFLGNLPNQVNFTEVARRENPTAASAFRVPPHYSVDARKVQLHFEALAYAEEHKVPYVTAVMALQRSN